MLGKPGNEAFRRQIARLIVKRPLAGAYLGGVRWFLRGLDRLFGPVAEDQRPGGWVDRLFRCQPWTAVSYVRLQILAFFYPLAFILIGSDIMFILLFAIDIFHAGTGVLATSAVVVVAVAALRDFEEGLWSLLIINLLILVMGLFLCVEWGEEASVRQESGVLFLVFTLIFLPVFNAPVDWLSLGATRGLLNRIAGGTHGWRLALLWSVLDVALALFFLFLITFSAWLALSLARYFSSPLSISFDRLDRPLIPLGRLRDIISGNDPISIGVWMILASTLIPTFLHFLIALLAFVTLPFSNRNFRKVIGKLRKARRIAVIRSKGDKNQAADAVPVHEYARGWAMVYFFVSWPLVLFVWFVLVSAISYSSFKALSWMFLLLL